MKFINMLNLLFFVIIFTPVSCFNIKSLGDSDRKEFLLLY